MKKNIFRIFAAIIIMTLVIAPPLAYSSLLGMAIKKISPAALTRIGGSAKIPAVVKSVSTNGATALNVLNLTLTGAQLGGIAGAVIGTGIGLGIYAANPSWFIENGIRVLNTVGGVDVVKDTTVQVPPADAAPQYDYTNNFGAGPYPEGAQYGIGYYGTDCAAADAALLTKCQSLHHTPSNCIVNHPSLYNCIRQKTVKIVTHNPGEPYIQFYINAYCKYSTACDWDHIDQTSSESIGPSGLADTLGPQLGNNDQKAWGLVGDVLNRISGALNNPSNELNAEPGLMDDIQERLQEGISANALSDIETSTDAGTGDGAVPADADDVYGLNAGDVLNAVLDALKGQELSSKQIADEIANALASGEGLTAADIAAKIWAAAPNAVTNPQDSTGAAANAIGGSIDQAAANIDASIDQAAANIVDAITNKEEGPNAVIPVDPDVLVPDKLSLTDVLNNFYSGLGNLPIVQTFSGMAITAGGSPVLCVNLPAMYGGSRCQNFSSYQDDLNMVGSVLLSFMTIFMMVYLFRGGN